MLSFLLCVALIILLMLSTTISTATPGLDELSMAASIILNAASKIPGSPAGFSAPRFLMNTTDMSSLSANLIALSLIASNTSDCFPLLVLVIALISEGDGALPFFFMKSKYSTIGV